MDLFFLICFIVLPLSAAAVLLLLLQNQSRTQKTPPGPPGLPLLGNILDVGAIPHQTFHNLKPKYGSILWLKLGLLNTMVVQSAKAAEDFFKNHDLSFCDRRCIGTMTALNYNRGSIILAPFGPHWRSLRRLCSEQLMSSRRLKETSLIRQKCVDDMIGRIEDDSAAARGRGEPGEVNLAHTLFLMAFNLVGNLVLSKDVFNSQSKEGHAFYDAMISVSKGAGEPNLAEFFPFLRFLDPQGLKRKMGKDMGRALKIVEGFVKERIQEHELGREKGNDFLDVLLGHQEDGKDNPHNISDHIRNILILEMFFAGSDTTSSTTEWAMAELIRDSNSMRKAKEELNQVVGQNRKVEESDLDQLPYLKAVVKETLRLHPVVPLLIPRNTIQDTTFMGYIIPKDTQVFVNVWSIGRDPEVWDDPLNFKPERFLGSEIDYIGQNFELIPFGAGRRACVGLPLAHRVLHLSLASLIHCFDWELASSHPDTMDMKESMGISVRKLVPLKAVPTKQIS